MNIRTRTPLIVGVAFLGLVGMAGPAAAATDVTVGEITQGKITIFPDGLDPIEIDFGTLGTTPDPCGVNADAGVEVTVTDDNFEWETKVTDVFGTTTIEVDLGSGLRTYTVELEEFVPGLFDPPDAQDGTLTGSAGVYDLEQNIGIVFHVQEVTVGQNSCTNVPNGDCDITLLARDLEGTYTEDPLADGLPDLDGTVTDVDGPTATATAGPCNNTLLAQIGTADVEIDDTNPLELVFPQP